MAFTGGLGEHYCSQKCYNAGGATVTKHLLQNWTGDCSVCRGPVSLRVGSVASMVCWKPGLFLFHCGSPSCVEAVGKHVRQSDACAVCGAPMSEAQDTAKPVLARVVMGVLTLCALGLLTFWFIQFFIKASSSSNPENALAFTALFLPVAWLLYFGWLFGVQSSWINPRKPPAEATATVICDNCEQMRFLEDVHMREWTAAQLKPYESYKDITLSDPAYLVRASVCSFCVLRRHRKGLPGMLGVLALVVALISLVFQLITHNDAIAVMCTLILVNAAVMFFGIYVSRKIKRGDIAVLKGYDEMLVEICADKLTAPEYNCAIGANTSDLVVRRTRIQEQFFAPEA